MRTSHTRTQIASRLTQLTHYNCVCSGRIFFDNVRVPREGLLNKYSDVDESGVYSSSVERLRDRFLKVLTGSFAYMSRLTSGFIYVGE